jgi:hypothetical protein
MTGPYGDRLTLERLYTIFEVDLERLRIRIQDDTAEFTWYPAELFMFDLAGCSEEEAREQNLGALRFRLATTRDSFGEAFRSGIYTTRRQLAAILEDRGVKTGSRSLEALIGLFHDTFPEPIPHGRGTRVQLAINNWYTRQTRIEIWLERTTPETVTHDQLDQCFRISRELHVRVRDARKALEFWCKRNGLVLK